LEAYYNQYKSIFKDDASHHYSEDMMSKAPRAFLNAQGV
jgi:hypothetical protein